MSMKWKIIKRYIAAMVLTTFIVLTCLWSLNVINAFYYFSSRGSVQSYDLYDKDVNPSLFTEKFGKNIQWIGSQPKVDDAHLNNLKEFGIWFQILDSNATEVYNRFRPAGFPSHYAPDELVTLCTQSSTIKGYSLFIEPCPDTNPGYSYIVAFPYTLSEKKTFLFNPSTLFGDLARISILVLLVTGCVMLLVSYFFSNTLARPVILIIDHIKALATGDYTRRVPSDGIYAEVNRNLGTLADNLIQGEAERKKTEQLREEWIANITHDLKTPLSSIKGYAEILRDTEYRHSEEDIRKYGGIILGKANYLEGLTEDLKLTYRLKDTGSTEEFQLENLVSVARDAVIDILNTPGYENADISFETDNDNIPCLCSKKLLLRTFENILYNSLVHNPEKPRIRVHISVTSAIHILLEDTGRGIPADELARLFERYYRGTGTGEAHKGSGLGLAIAKQVILLHGGSIMARSQPGQGTAISISLPKPSSGPAQ